MSHVTSYYVTRSLRDPAVNPRSPPSLTRVFPQGFENVTKLEAGYRRLVTGIYLLTQPTAGNYGQVEVEI